MSYHFIGLGGIGMSALARILLQKGKKVQGSDLKATPLLESLQKEGAKVRIGHSEDLSGATTVIYSSDVKGENIELKKAKELLLPLLHRSDLLKLLMEEQKALLVTGTHGKTTTTALLVSVLEEAGLDPTFVIGGIHRQWKTNGKAGKGDYFVAEADESDGSFLKGAAYGAIVTNLENDHIDYWKEEQKLDEAFGVFCNQVQKHLFWCGDDIRLRKLKPKGISYGFGENDIRVVAKPMAKGLSIDLFWDKEYRDIELSLYGRHNALNGAAVFGLCMALGIPEEAIRRAFANFAGTGRRLEWKGSVSKIDVYDDYGHHPTEIKATLQALREKAGERRLIAVFQPHRYTRVRDLFDEFKTAFCEADLVIQTDIFSAGEKEIPGLNDAFKKGTFYVPRAELEEKVASLLKPHDVVVTFGAGDITKAGDQILRLIHEPKYKVAILFGGTSSEHAVSIMSARTFVENIDRTLYDVELFGLTKEGVWVHGDDAFERLGETGELVSADVLKALTACDIAIPVFHGQQGEDGMIQGFLETLNLPYVGCDYRACAISMHKGWTKQIAIMAAIPTSRYSEVEKRDYVKNRSLEIEQYPVWIKPVHLGSSIGVTRVTNYEDALKAADFAFTFDDTIMIDQEVRGREIEISLLGNDDVKVAPPGEIIKPDIFHSYEKKYGAGASKFDIPAKLTPTQTSIVQEMAITMFQKTGCKGLARIDFFLDEQGHFWLNEINPFPGFTKTSAYPEMWEKAGYTMQQLCDELIILGLHRSRQLSKIRGK